jgi:hypothetical protein
MTRSNALSPIRRWKHVRTNCFRAPPCRSRDPSLRSRWMHASTSPNAAALVAATAATTTADGDGFRRAHLSCPLNPSDVPSSPPRPRVGAQRGTAPLNPYSATDDPRIAPALALGARTLAPAGRCRDSQRWPRGTGDHAAQAPLVLWTVTCQDRAAPRPQTYSFLCGPAGGKNKVVFPRSYARRAPRGYEYLDRIGAREGRLVRHGTPQPQEKNRERGP